MPNSKKVFNGTHPSGKTAEIVQHGNGYCSWIIRDQDGKARQTDTAPSLPAAKAGVKKRTYNIGDAASYGTVTKQRWKWVEVPG